MQDRATRMARENVVRQDTILLEAADRIRRFSGMSQQVKHQAPLIVVVTKYDAWCSLLGTGPLEPPFVNNPAGPPHALDIDRIDQMSRKVRELLFDLTPEIVTAAEGFASQVIYIPVSAMGRGPEVDAASGMLGIRPQDIRPQWVEMPLLYVLCRWMKGLIPYIHSRASSSPANSTSPPRRP